MLSCPASPMEAPISILAFGAPFALTHGSLFIEDDPYIRLTPKVDAITMHCIGKGGGDTDGDGCSDATENGSDPLLGGDRSFVNPWDFYDVAGPDGVPIPDGVIDLPNDILGVMNHQGSAPGPPYDVQYDRGPAAGLSWHGTAPPDGVIDLPNDILGVIAQFNHRCV
ncbi:MAG: hypothetical protein J4N26_05310 [Chloroflexi bacterium]|nr:hypothetical protein [Chloroflexota bacterium]